MDFDSIITFLLIIVFFVLPGILKQIKAVKRKSTKPKKAKKKAKKSPSIFDRIGEKIQQFINELEQQARQQRQAGKKQGSEWDRLAEDEIPSQAFETIDQEEYFSEPEPLIPAAAVPEIKDPAYTAAVKEPEEDIIKQDIKESLSGEEAVIQHPGAAKYVFKS
ncbi:MAG: hypothetical protein ABFR31_09095, partial [Thermodesulfobacteriota bacterium]